jgi:hypothetical protein
MIEEERREASNMMHASLDQLDKTIRAWPTLYPVLKLCKIFS